MTLIFSHISPITGLFALSDILTSIPAQDEAGQVTIPFRDTPMQHSNAGHELAGTMQKSVIFGRTMVMFAGRVIVARAVIERIRELSDDGEREVDLEATVRGSGLSDAELSEVSLIYHYNPDAPHIVRTSWNCDEVDVAGSNPILSAGSGKWNFFDNLSSDIDIGENRDVNILLNLIGRLAAHPVSELTGTDTLNFLYGGWFELTYRSAQTFKKVPYAVRFWAKMGNVLASGGPINFGWYLGGILNVTRLQVREHNCVQRVDQRDDVIPDFLGRKAKFDRKWTVRPKFIIHVVFDEEQPGVAYLLTQHDHEEDYMLLEATERGIQMRVSADLRLRLLDLPHCREAFPVKSSFT